MQGKIIELLKKSEGYLSGEEISEALLMSRAAIWKYIESLREAGYEIVAVPHLGYQLVSSPDKLFPAEIQAGLGTRTFGKKIIYYDTVASTMDAAFELGIKGAPEGTLVLAEGQSRGRGRLGRTWMSPKGKGIYLSIVLRPNIPPAQTAKLTLLSAVSLADAIKGLTGLSPAIKWPNDIFINHKKVAGILTELSAEADRVKFVIAGIGLNVNAKADTLPAAGTSLRSEMKRKISRVEMVKAILCEFEKWYDVFNKEGFGPILQYSKEISMTLHRRVKVTDPAGVIEGEAVDIDHDGGLMIRKDSGVLVKRLSGDVIQVR